MRLAQYACTEVTFGGSSSGVLMTASRSVGNWFLLFTLRSALLMPDFAARLPTLFAVCTTALLAILLVYVCVCNVCVCGALCVLLRVDGGMPNQFVVSLL